MNLKQLDLTLRSRVLHQINRTKLFSHMYGDKPLYGRVYDFQTKWCAIGHRLYLRSREDQWNGLYKCLLEAEMVQQSAASTQ